MNRASKILWMATLSRAAAEDGQDSMRKLALLPLTFLSLSGNTSYLASILASAVGFLEGYSVSDLEADINFVKTPSGDFVAHTQLKLVPYTRWRAPTLVSSTPVVDTLPSSSTKTLVASHHLSISHVIADEVPHTFSAEEVSQLQRFKDSFKSSASAVDYVANDLLRTTDSVKVAKAVLRFSAQVGLTIPRSTLQELVQRLKPEEAFFASRICQEFAFEVNLERLHRSSLICSQRVLHLVDSPRRRREESKLERLRRTTSPSEAVATLKGLKFKMSGESIFGLYVKSAVEQKQLSKNKSPYTGVYEKHMAEPEKPAYSTFFEKGKQYDGTNVRFFKQREAIIGKNVGDTVDPRQYLKKGNGVRYIAPVTHEEKMYRKPPVDNNSIQLNQGGQSGDAEKSSTNMQHGADNNPVSSKDGRFDAGCSGENGNGAHGSASDAALYSYGSGDYGADYRGGDAFSRDATKDFVASNIVEVSNMVPKRQKMQAPLPTSRKSFGEAPAYLSRVKSEIAQEKAFVQSLEEAKAQRKQQLHAKYIYLLPREEHEKLVQQMRRRNDECISELQKIPFSKDTPGTRKRKMELEKTIADIEAALKKLDKDALFIYKDDPVNGQWSKEIALKEAQRYAAHSH